MMDYMSLVFFKSISNKVEMSAMQHITKALIHRKGLGKRDRHCLKFCYLSF